MAPRLCSAAAALGVIGEKWSLLVVRELAFGVHRFDSIVENTGAPRDILTNRLRSLEASEVVEKRQYSERPPRFEYHLTQAGRELRPILLSLGQWGTRWAADSPPVRWEHTCGETLELVHTCKACGEAVTGGRDVQRLELTPDWTSAA
jgi:DNA-binding HxlR family transcriptional regulator